MMNNLKLSDSQLLSLYKSGDEEAFRLLLERHNGRVYTTIFLIVKDRYIAEDLTQDVFIKVVKTVKAGKYNEEGKFLPWVLRISHNIAIDHFRKAKRNPTIRLDDGNDVLNTLRFSEDPIDTSNVRSENHKKIRALIKTLPQAQKEVLIMRHFADMSFKEIADMTGVSINTALGRMRYALINLRKKLKQHNIAYDPNYYPK
jgi:RNA polymerase sigma-70 factor (ECF subfamily)